MKLQNNLYTTTGWEITEDDFDPEEIVTTGSNFMVGNGYLGYRGTLVELGEQDRYMVCIVSDTYDTADGKVAEKSIHFSKLASNTHAADGLNNSFQINNARHQRHATTPPRDFRKRRKIIPAWLRVRLHGVVRPRCSVTRKIRGVFKGWVNP